MHNYEQIFGADRGVRLACISDYRNKLVRDPWRRYASATSPFSVQVGRQSWPGTVPKATSSSPASVISHLGPNRTSTYPGCVACVKDAHARPRILLLNPICVDVASGRLLNPY